MHYEKSTTGPNLVAMSVFRLNWLETGEFLTVG
jgi:hypothetical protein